MTQSFFYQAEAKEDAADPRGNGQLLNLLDGNWVFRLAMRLRPVFFRASLNLQHRTRPTGGFTFDFVSFRKHRIKRVNRRVALLETSARRSPAPPRLCYSCVGT